MRIQLLLAIFLCSGSADVKSEEPETPTERLAPVYRHTIVVSDLERSFSLYRDILGLEVGRINDLSEDSYSAVFFNTPTGAPTRFAYLSGEDGQQNILGMAEVPSIELPESDGVRGVAWVQTVANPEQVLEQVKQLGLQVIPPTSFVSRETGTPGIEAGVIDFDGHLVMFYGLTLPGGDGSY